jgi:hypothetical protein
MCHPEEKVFVRRPKNEATSWVWQAGIKITASVFIPPLYLIANKTLTIAACMFWLFAHGGREEDGVVSASAGLRT